MSGFSNEDLLSPTFNEVEYLQSVLRSGAYQGSEELGRVQQRLEETKAHTQALIHENFDKCLRQSEAVAKAEVELGQARDSLTSLKNAQQRLSLLIDGPYQHLRSSLAELNTTNQAVEVLGRVKAFLMAVGRLTWTMDSISAAPSKEATPQPFAVLLQQARYIHEIDALLQTGDLNGIYIVEEHMETCKRAAATVLNRVYDLLSMRSLAQMSEPSAILSASPALSSSVSGEVALGLSCALYLGALPSAVVDCMNERKRNCLRVIHRELQLNVIEEAGHRLEADQRNRGVLEGAIPAFGQALLQQLQKVCQELTLHSRCVVKLWEVLLTKKDVASGRPLIALAMGDGAEVKTKESEPRSSSRPSASSTSAGKSAGGSALLPPPPTGERVSRLAEPAQILSDFLILVLDRLREALRQLQQQTLTNTRFWGGGGDSVGWAEVYPVYMCLLHGMVGTSRLLRLSWHRRGSADSQPLTGESVWGGGLLELVALLEETDQTVRLIRSNSSSSGEMSGSGGALRGGRLWSGSSLGRPSVLNPTLPHPFDHFFNSWLADMSEPIRKEVVKAAAKVETDRLRPVREALQRLAEAARVYPNRMIPPTSSPSSVGHSGYDTRPATLASMPPREDSGLSSQFFAPLQKSLEKACQLGVGVDGLNGNPYAVQLLLLGLLHVLHGLLVSFKAITQQIPLPPSPSVSASGFTTAQYLHVYIGALSAAAVDGLRTVAHPLSLLLSSIAVTAAESSECGPEELNLLRSQLATNPSSVAAQLASWPLEVQLEWLREELLELQKVFQHRYDESVQPFLLSAVRVTQEWVPRCLEEAFRQAVAADATAAEGALTGAAVVPVVLPQLERFVAQFRDGYYMRAFDRNPSFAAGSRQMVDVLLSRLVSTILIRPVLPSLAAAEQEERWKCVRAGHVARRHTLQKLSALLPLLVDGLRECGVPRSAMILQGIVQQLLSFYHTLVTEAVDLVGVNAAAPPATLRTVLCHLSPFVRGLALLQVYIEQRGTAVRWPDCVVMGEGPLGTALAVEDAVFLEIITSASAVVEREEGTAELEPTLPPPLTPAGEALLRQVKTVWNTEVRGTACGAAQLWSGFTAAGDAGS